MNDIRSKKVLDIIDKKNNVVKNPLNKENIGYIVFLERDSEVKNKLEEMNFRVVYPIKVNEALDNNALIIDLEDIDSLERTSIILSYFFKNVEFKVNVVNKNEINFVFDSKYNEEYENLLKDINLKLTSDDDYYVINKFKIEYIYDKYKDKVNEIFDRIKKIMMKVENKIDKKAISEVIEILNHIDNKLIENVPKKFMKFLFDNRDVDYLPCIDFSNSVWDDYILDDTKAIIAFIYRIYIVSGSERERIIDKEREKIINEENTNKDKDVVTETSLIKVKEKTWFKKVLNNIRNFFVKK